MPYYCKSLLQVREKLIFKNRGSLKFSIFICFLCFFLWLFCFIFFWFGFILSYFILLLFYRYLLSKEREKEMVLIWVGREVRRISEGLGEGTTVRVYCMEDNLFSV